MMHPNTHDPAQANAAVSHQRPTELLSIEESPTRRERPVHGLGLWRLGFRPFYLGAALFSAIAIVLWLSAFLGGLTLPMTAQINPLYWHAHEMVFGFALAVIAGFLLTASNNWSGILPAAGRPLALLFALWASARLALFSGYLLPSAVADLAFIMLFAALLGRVLYLAKLWENFLLLGLILVLAGLNGSFYLIALGVLSADPLTPIELALGVIALIIIIMAGRVIPMFTQSAVRGIRIWKSPFLSRFTPLASALGLIGWLTLSPHLACLGCVLAAAINLARWLGWKPWRCLAQPMIWVLHLAYLWIPLAFLCLGLNALGLVARSLPVHMLAVGAMGLMIVGMITRTAQGHTGRPISASPLEIRIFVLIALSALCRVLIALPDTAVVFSPALSRALFMISGGAWSAAFALYLYRYTGWLWRPRLDGKPG